MTEFWIFGIIPFFVGLLVGAIVPQRERRKHLSLIVAPLVSGLVVCAIMFAWDWDYRISHPNGHRDGQPPAVLQSLLVTIVYSPSLLLLGAIPAVAGAALSELCKEDLRKRSTHD